MRIGTLVIPAHIGSTAWSTLQTQGFDLVYIGYYSDSFAVHDYAQWDTYLTGLEAIGMQGIFSVGEEWRYGNFQFAWALANKARPGLWAIYHWDEPVWNIQHQGGFL